MNSIEHEEAIIKAFVQRDKQERFLSFIASAKNRRKFTRELPNFPWFDKRFATLIPWKVDPALSLWGRHLQGIENVSRLIHSKGAGKTCWVVSNSPSIDGKEMDLDNALESVVVSDWGTILSCVPGKLAYFKGEHDSLLLMR
jgi:hypothetical protein